MVKLVPVLEPRVGECPFWPVGTGTSLLVVPRAPTPDQVAKLAWALVWRDLVDDDGAVVAADAAEAVELFTTAAEDRWFAPGGLRVEAGGVALDPGCCLGLDEWRDWVDVAGGGEACFGHAPGLLVAQHDGLVRLTLVDDDEDRAIGPAVELPRADLPLLLHRVRLDLLGFRDALRAWARDVVPEQADRFADHVDRRLAIGAPLEF